MTTIKLSNPEFARALSLAMGVIAPIVKTTRIPTLQAVRLTLANGELDVMATNLSESVVTSLKVTGDDGDRFNFVVKFEHLKPIMKHLSNGNIEISVSGRVMDVSTKSGRFSLPYADFGDELPEIDFYQQGQLIGSVLTDVFHRVDFGAHCQSKSEREIQGFHGVRWSGQIGCGIVCASQDGWRLAESTTGICHHDFSILISEQTMKLARVMTEGDICTILMLYKLPESGGRHVLVKDATRLIFSHKSDANFYDYAEFFKEKETEQINLDEAIAAVEAVLPVAKGNISSRVTLSANTETGTMTISAHCDGVDISRTAAGAFNANWTCAINGEFLLKTLKAYKPSLKRPGGYVYIACAGEETPVYFRHKDMRAIIMTLTMRQ